MMSCAVGKRTLTLKKAPAPLPAKPKRRERRKIQVSAAEHAVWVALDSLRCVGCGEPAPEGNPFCKFCWRRCRRGERGRIFFCEQIGRKYAKWGDYYKISWIKAVTIAARHLRPPVQREEPWES